MPWDLSTSALGDSAKMDEKVSKVLLEHHPSLAPSHNEPMNSAQAIMHDNKKPKMINREPKKIHQNGSDQLKKGGRSVMTNGGGCVVEL